LHAALWLAWHWKDVRQATRDLIFEDMCRIRGTRRFLAKKYESDPVAEMQEQFRMIQDIYE
jgi:hypothetical protein